MSAFTHRFILTFLAAVLFTTGARAQVDDSGIATNRIEQISVEAWEAAHARAYDARRADRISALDRTLHDGVRWAARKARRATVVAAVEGQRLVREMRRTFGESVIAGRRIAAAAIARSEIVSGRDIVRGARDIAIKARRLVAEARRALTHAVAERRQMLARAEDEAAATAIRRFAADARRFVAGVDRAFVAMAAESRRALTSAALRSVLAREGARDTALMAGKAFRGGSGALHLLIKPRPVVKTRLRVDVENVVGAVVAHFSAAPEAAPTIRVWKLSRPTVEPAAALTGSVASGLVHPAALAGHDVGDAAMKARFDAALRAVQRVGAWLSSAR